MLHVTSLKGKVNVKQVKDALQDIPCGGDARKNAYDKAMEMIQSQQEGYRKLAMDTLSWVRVFRTHTCIAFGSTYCDKRPLLETLFSLLSSTILTTYF
jgi:hypothetical protein